MALARPLVKYCCQRLAAFFELEQKLAKFQGQAPITPSSSSVPSLKTRHEAHPESTTNEDDSVFDSTLSNIKQEPDIKTEPGTRPSLSDNKSGRKTSSSRDRKHTATTPSALGDGEVPIIKMKVESEVPSNDTTPSSYFHWCTHHQALMLQLCCIIQTIAIRCPTAYVQTKVNRRGLSARDGGKGTMPLSLLPMGLTELPMPRTLGLDLQKKVLIMVVVVLLLLLLLMLFLSVMFVFCFF